MNVVSELYHWISFLLFWGEVVLWVWAAVDCSTRKAAAFPAVNKLSKGAWLAITVTATALGLLFGQPWNQTPDPTNIFILLATIVASVYLADVRPAVREVSGGNNRW